MTSTDAPARDYKITTNHVPRDLMMMVDIPSDVWSDFDYVDTSPESDEPYTFRFFRYRGDWYDANDIPSTRGWGVGAVGSSLAADGWDGCASDSYFSALVVRYPVDETGNVDTDRIVVGYLTV